MGETARYIRHWLRADSLWENPCPSPARYCHLAGTSAIFKRLFHCSIKLVVYKMGTYEHTRCHTSFAVKWILWSEHYCKARWIRHSVSACLVVLHTGKHCIRWAGKIHIQSVYSPDVPSMMQVAWCINLPSGSWPITPGNGSVLCMDVAADSGRSALSSKQLIIFLYPRNN